MVCKKIFYLIIAFHFFTLILMKFNYAQENYEFNESLINITLKNPKYGGSPVDRFDLIIETDVPSECKYSFNPLLNYSDITSHTNFFETETYYNHQIKNFELNLPENEEKIIYIKCKNISNEYVNDKFPINFSLMIDRSNPIIKEAKANPNYVIEKLELDLIAETDDYTICEFFSDIPSEEELTIFNSSSISNFKKIHKKKLTSYSNPIIEDNKKYLIILLCMNKAELFSDVSMINFTTNLSAKNIIIDKYPTGLIFDNSLELTVITNRDSTCRYGEDYKIYFPQKNSKVHFIQLLNLNNSQYSYKIRCDFDQGEPNVIYDELNFIISDQTPSKVFINTSDSSCDNTSLSVKFQTDSLGLKGFYYYVVDSKNNFLFDLSFTDKNVLNLSLNLTRNETYYWYVFSQNIAEKNSSISKSSGIYIKPEKDCFKKPITINLDQVYTLEGIKINISCNENCYVNYSLNCLNYSTYRTPILITENKTLCYIFEDNNKIQQKNISFYIEYCNNNTINCCGLKKAVKCENNNCSEILTECDLTLLDSDEDGIKDLDEEKCKLDKFNSSDANLDFDEDGLNNKEECIIYKTDALKKDTDGDGALDGIEVKKSTNPLDIDSYPEDLDSDNDGITDKKEKECGLNKNINDVDEDKDGDGLSNKDECLIYKTNINNIDTDEDGFSDKIEIEKKKDPLDYEDYPKNPILLILIIIFLVIFISIGGYLIMKNMPKINLISNKKNENKLNKSNDIENKKNLKKNNLKIISNNNINNNSINNLNLQQKIDKNENFQNKDFAKITPSMDFKPITEGDPNYLIKRKRKQLKLRKMESVFDEFVENTNIKSKERSDGVFDELDQIAKKRINKNT